MSSPLEAVPAQFYARPTLQVARDLLGCTLIHATTDGVLSGVIVETEAYVASTDEACHAFRGRTVRTAVLFGPPGVAYVYRSYGIHAMLNVVTEEEGTAAAVLIRALEPIAGEMSMRRHRGIVERAAPPHLTDGPGRLCQALDIRLEMNGFPLQRPPLYIVRPPEPQDERGPVIQTTRIGITRAMDLPWRFYLRESAAVSVRDRAAEARFRA